MRRAVYIIYIGIAAILAGGCIRVEGQEKPEAEQRAGFEITITEVTANSARVVVTPDNLNGLYYVDVLKEQHYNTYSEYGLQRFVDAVIESAMAKNNIDKPQALESMLTSGQTTHEFTALEAENNYCAVAIYLTADGQISGQIGTAHFTTTKKSGKKILIIV